jgi:hypothetical protein
MKKIPFTMILSLPLIIVAAGPADAAFHYAARTTVEGDGLRGSQVSTVDGWVDGPNARIEFQEGDASGMFAAGSYLLTNDGGQSIYVVNSAEKTISEIDLAQIFQMVSSMLEATGGIVQMEFADFSSEKIAEGPGEPILGYSTTRYQFKTGYTMKVGVLGFTRENRAENDQEFYCTDEIDAAGFDVWLRPDRFRTGNESIDQLIAQQYETMNCLPLRNRVVTTMTGQRGRESSTTTTTEVTSLSEEAAPADAFRLPTDGFTMTPLVPELPADFSGNQPQNQDSEAPRRPRLRDLIGR